MHDNNPSCAAKPGDYLVDVRNGNSPDFADMNMILSLLSEDLPENSLGFLYPGKPTLGYLA